MIATPVPSQLTMKSSENMISAAKGLILVNEKAREKPASVKRVMLVPVKIKSAPSTRFCTMGELRCQ